MHINYIEKIEIVFINEEPDLENKLIVDYIDDNNDNQQATIDISGNNTDINGGFLEIQEIAELNGTISLIERLLLKQIEHTNE